ncbi:MAG TPA: glucose-6-phosphate dehydrogenase assembly protein OpcA [Thermoleophilaceae bacterium]|nr:glucose-6-phosphate dehydrogenase assembly protein OpcA [Thermoleophilaceae bacterium]
MTETGTVWSERDTTPSAVEEALRELLKGRHAAGESYAPARVLNLVVIADREWRGEIQNRLDRVGRYHASRTILCAVEQGRTEIDAWATVTAEEEDVEADRVAVAREQVVLDIGPKHLEHLDRIVDPLLVMDLSTLVWSPHDHDEAVDSLMRIAQSVLLDSVSEADAPAAIRRAAELKEHAYVVDLAWLRSTPWRERVAATFDPPQWRPELGRISAVTVRHHPDSAVAGVLLLGWLARRLGWEPGPLADIDPDGRSSGTGKAADGDVGLVLEPDHTMPIPGLAGVTIDTRTGLSVSLDRGPGGLSARRRTPDGHEAQWTVLGASRGEAGILGEGIRQSLLRDKGYGQALTAAGAMVCS